MANSRTFNVKRNICFGVINKVMTLGAPFLIRTIIIYKLGAEYLGLNGLFASILQVLNMAELGFSSAITFRLYKPMAENDEATICALMALYRKVYRIIGLSILAAGLMLMPFIRRLINGSCPDDINIYVIYLICLINTAMSYLFFAYKSVLLSVSQRQDILSNIDTLLAAIKSAIQIILLCLFNNYYLYIIWNPIFTLMNNIIIGVITKKRFPKYICGGKLPHEDIIQIMTQIKGLAIGKFGLVSRNSFDNIILSAFCGLVEVAIYSNYFYILSSVLAFITIAIQAMVACVGNSIAVESKDKNYIDFIKFNFYFSWIGSWCTICLFCLYQPFMRLWAGESLIAPFSTMILCCLYFYVSQMGQVRSIYATASGIWWEFRYLQIGEMIGNLVLNVGLGCFFGMNGIIGATIITVFVFSVIGIGRKTINIYFEKNAREYFVNCAIYAVITVVAAGITYVICSLVQGTNFVVLISRMVICCIVPNMLFLCVACSNKKYRNYMLQFVNIMKMKR